MSFLDNLFTLSSQVSAYLQQAVGYLQTVAATVSEGKVSVDIGTTLTGDFSSTVADVTTTGTLTSTDDAVTVVMEGRAYAGFSIAAGLTGVVTFEASLNGGTRWSSVQSYSLATLPPTISGATLTLSGSADERGIIVPIGATHVRARLSTATSGSGAATIRATVAGVLEVMPQLDTLHTDLAVLTGAVTAGRVAVDLTTAVTGYLSTLAGSVSASRVAVDLTTAVTTYLSNLPTLATYLNTLQGAITSARMQVDLATTPTANLATLAGAITSSRMAVNVDSTTTGKLDTLHTDLATTLALLLNPGASVCGQTSSTNSSAAFGSQVCTLGVFIKNISTNGQKSYIFPGGTASASNGYELAIGEERWFPCANMSTLRHFSTASGANLCWEAI